MEDIRNQIDGIDQQIIKLLGERADLVKEIGKLKNTSGSEIKDDERELDIRESLKKLAKKEGLSEEFVNHLYTHIFIESRRIQDSNS